MNYKLLLNTLGSLLIFLGLFMLIPIAFSIYYHDNDIPALLISAGITIGTGILMRVFFKGEGTFTAREGLAIAGLGWLLAAGFGAIPYMIYGTFHNYIDAYFEAMSGFTTTGATVLYPIEAQPHGIIFWRGLTHWLGGMGIIVLAIALLPAIGRGAMQLYKSEVPGPTADRLKPKITHTARLLWIVYAIISLMEVIALKVAGMSLYDALCHMFATMSTGGFSTKDASVGAFNNPIYDIIIIFFMFISGANFALNYRLIFKGDIKCFFKDPEFKFYTGVVLVSVGLITYNLYTNHIYHTIASSLRFASFQAVSIVTTTGFTTADFDKWPDLSRFLLLALMFIGGCAGSTGGAIKNIRILLLIKHGIREIFKLIHPDAVVPIRLGKTVVSEEIMNSVTAFFFLYMGLFTLSTIIMAFLGLDLVTAIASTAATIGNIGPGLAKVGASQNYIHIPYIGKIVLIINMVLGRLEIYTILVLLMPGLWKK